LEAAQEVQVVKATQKHRYSIVTLTKKFFPYMPFNLQEVERRLGQQNVFYYVALLNGNTVGYIDFKFSSEGATILGLAVLEEFRGKGIGSMLLNKALDVIRANGFNEARVMTAVDNAKALDLYKKFGFAIKGKFERRINNQDVYLLVKPFGDGSERSEHKEVI
jgi:ribosomal protein S18 acetylase RimI-like enzyme